MKTQQFDSIIIGGGASGLMAAITAGQRGRKVCVIDHAKKLGSKILISGGGRCNFTNLGISPERYLSKNKHFCKSALAQYTQFDFIELVKKHNIAYHEKTLGQLFCDASAKQIVNMLLDEAHQAGVEFSLGTEVEDIVKTDDGFKIITSKGEFESQTLVMASGGLSIPKIGATNFGYKVAKQFNLDIVETMPALVPFTFSEKDKAVFADLSGIAFDAEVSIGKTIFKESVLFTHRGLSGPAILQISSYWKAGDELRIKVLPELNWNEFLTAKRSENSKQELKTALNEVLQKRFVNTLIEQGLVKNLALGQVSDKYINQLEQLFNNFNFKPNGTEGYRKAEVTIGGISTAELNAKTLETKKVEGLFFIGELVDVTGWLGGYNFQWAWSSGFAAGQVI
jgi:predicted Rossmann fold flavoprotein